MNEFFRVKSLGEVMEMVKDFPELDIETIPIGQADFRILGQDLIAGKDLPGFRRSAMDGFAVVAGSTFGSSESSPAWLEVVGTILMGDIPDFHLAPGQAARISTGGMLPNGADSVVMVEHTQMVDNESVEIYKSVAPMQYVIDASEDFAKGGIILEKGSLLRPQEVGLAAGLGFCHLPVFKVPKVGIISTGDEVVPVDVEPGPGKVRDINSYTLAGFIRQAHAQPVLYGIVKDDPAALLETCEKALKETDMLLISGGSSVGTRDYTVDVLEKLSQTEVMFHGISISPGKPTILARSGNKPVWGLPGQVVSAMVVFKVAVLPFLNRLRGDSLMKRQVRVPAVLSRNVASAQGRTDFIRVRLEQKESTLMAHPVMGKSGLIRTMVLADGLVEIDENTEGLERDSLVEVVLL